MINNVGKAYYFSQFLVDQFKYKDPVETGQILLDALTQCDLTPHLKRNLEIRSAYSQRDLSEFEKYLRHEKIS